MHTFWLVSASVLAAAVVACSSSDPRADTIAKLTGDAAAGKATYTSQCASCHGADAKSGTTAKNITGESNAEAYAQILAGGGGMPAFSSLSDQQIANVWAYVLTLK
ncbi:MAG: cytochrome c [Polyangiaceae bacterium]